MYLGNDGKAKLSEESPLMEEQVMEQKLSRKARRNTTREITSQTIPARKEESCGDRSATYAARFAR